MKFSLRRARGYLSSDNDYIDEMCDVCGRYLDDRDDVLEAENETLKVTICKDCAYDIHRGCEENM